MKRQFIGRSVAVMLTASLIISPLLASAETAGTSTAVLIASLQAQIVQIQAQLMLLRGDVNTTKADVVEIKNELKLLRILRKGMTGDDVAALQEYLAQFPDIYPEGSVTGYFGSKTEQAIKRFQEKQGVVSGGNSSATGYGQVGPKTLAKLNAMLAKENGHVNKNHVAHQTPNGNNGGLSGVGTSTSTATTTPPTVAQVTICHIPPGNPNAMSTLVVGSPAVSAHMNHGDTMGACPVSGGGGNPPPPPPPPPTPDTTAPSVSMSTPTNGVTASGTISVSATASDNIGVVGVQFKLDGVNLDSEDVTAPYSVAWNTASTSNGSHVLSAVARDAAGNTATAALVNVTVTNLTVVPDVTAPAVSITAPANGGTVSGSIVVSATASDNVGVEGVQFKLNGTNLGSEDTSAPYAVTWDTTTSTNTAHTLSATARDLAGNLTTTSVSVSVLNIVPSGNTHSLSLSAGSSQYASFVDQSTFPSGDITIEAWVKPDSFAIDGYTPIFGKGDGYNDVGVAVVFHNENGITYLRGAIQGLPSGIGQADSIGVTDFDNHLNTWVHVAMTWDSGTANFVKLYVNGVEESSYALKMNNAASAINNSSNGGLIGAGRYNGGVTSGFDGKIDDVRIWNVVRSQSEIANNRNTELVGTESGLVHNWKLNNNGNDTSVNSNNLTLVNGAAYSTSIPY